MSPAKIVRIIGLLVVLVGAFVTIPMGAVVLAVVGLVVGYFVAAENRAGLFLMVIALSAGAAGSLDSIPAIGSYLTAILEGMQALLAASAVTVIGTVVYERIKE